MTNQQGEGRIIKMSRLDYSHFVVHKMQDGMLLDRIAAQEGPPELVCEVNNFTWERFVLNPSNNIITALRLQMKTQSWNIDEDRGSADVMMMMKYWITEALQEQIEERTKELAAMHSLREEVNTMTNVNDLIPHFVREAGFLHDRGQEQIVIKVIALLHPELF